MCNLNYFEIKVFLDDTFSISLLMTRGLKKVLKA